MISVPKPIKPLPLKTTDIDLWVNGVVTALDEGRLGVEALTSALNMILDQDGTLRPRPSLQLFGPQPTGKVLGKVFQFSINDGLNSTYYELIMQVVSGVANVYIATPEATEWTIVSSGTTFNTASLPMYIELAQKVLVLTGDDLTYLDLPTVPSAPALVRESGIDDPASAPTLTPTGLTGSVYDVWYAVTYNSTVGQTAPSPVAEANVSTARTSWDPTTQSISVDAGTIPAGVKSWNIYCATTSNGSSAPTLLLIVAGISPTQTTFIDNGSDPQILNTAAPLTNSTVGPKATRGVNINGRAFLWGDGTYNVSIGGDPGFEVDFSPANGGDTLPIAAGSGHLPTAVWNFRSGPGDPEIKAMTQDPGGKRYTISQNSVTYNGVQLTIWGAQEDYGYNGTSAPGSLITFKNNTYYLAYDSFYSTGTVPELQNLLNTDSVSQTLSLLSDFKSINQGALGGVDGSVYQQRLYYCLPIESSTNNQIWTLDLQRGGAWMKPWDIPCQGITIIQDNEANTHQLFVVNDQILESTYERMTNDNGVVFPTGAATGVIGFSKDLRTWAQVLKIVIVVLRGQGIINFTVTGWTLNSSTNGGKLETVGTGKFENLPATSGYGWNQGGYNMAPMLKWNDFYSISSSSIALSQDIDIPINQQLRYFLVQMNTGIAGCDFNISNIIPLQVIVGVKNLF